MPLERLSACQSGTPWNPPDSRELAKFFCVFPTQGREPHTTCGWTIAEPS